jgi:hypothetical protein
MLMGAVCYCFLDSSGYRKGPLPFETGGCYLLHETDVVGCVYLHGWSRAPSESCGVTFVPQSQL